MYVRSKWGGGGGGGVALRAALLATLLATALVTWFVASGDVSAEGGNTVTWTFPKDHKGIKALDLSAGSEFAYAITPDRALSGWGLNHVRQLDHPVSKVWPGNVNGRHSNRSLVEVDTTKFRQVDAGALHACAVTAHGEIECWGSNSHGQTNVPIRLMVTSEDSSIPTPQYTKVSAGGEHTCALRAVGDVNEVLCWGSNVHKQSKAPKGDFIDVSAGGQHTCAIERSGDVVCWGHNGHGQTIEPSGGSYHSISAGDDYTCALNSEGGALCWGSNMGHQEYPPAGEYTQITSGSWHACALWTEDDAPLRGKPNVLGHQLPPGNVDCWGDNAGGKATPPSKVVFKQISAGGTFTCGIRIDDYIQCWGFGSAAQTPLTQDTSGPKHGRVIARTSDEGAMEFRFQVHKPGPDNDTFLKVFRRFVPSDGSLTVGRWYYSDVLSFTEAMELPKGAEIDPIEFEYVVGRIGIRLLASGHIELALVGVDGSVKLIPQNHNRIPNPVEPNVWWRTDYVKFGG